MNNPPKGHTRASAMANTFVSKKEQSKKQGVEPKSLFKMQKFLAVKPRTNTINKGYKPAAVRHGSAMPAARRASTMATK